MKLATTTLMLCVGAMLALSMVMLYSAAVHEKGAHYLMMQLTWCGAGLVACVAGAGISYQFYKKLSWILLAGVIILLVLVLNPHFGVLRGGARRWFIYGGVSLQPSELAKLALIIALAHYGEYFQRKMGTFWKGLVIPSALFAAAGLLIYKEPDRGTFILLAAVTGLMLFLAGTRWFYLAMPIILGGAILGYLLVNDPVRGPRIYSWLHPELTKDGVGYQGYQAMLALGSGGWTGMGLGEGRQKLGFVPERHTDFILSVIGEELGLVATLGVVLGFILFTICGLFIAWRAKDLFGLLLAAGITSLIGFQAMINIGVVSGAFPNKGLSLPFISYGGSNLVLMLACVGILLNIARQAEREPEAQLADSAALEGAKAC